MTHVSDDVLAAVALGDPDVDPADRLHLDECPVCASEVAELVAVHDLVRHEARVTDPHLVDPGPGVWARIAAATTDSALAPAPPVLEPRADPEAVVAAVGIRNDELAARRPGSATPVEDGSGPRQRRRPAWWVVAAAAACILVGALVGRAVWPSGQPSADVVASVALTTLDASKQKVGTAEVIDATGMTQLRVDVPNMAPPATGFVEVWLINQDLKRMVSVGVMSTGQEVFPVPPNALAQGYTIVDLSHEQYDDRPQHSGDSLMRGMLPV